MRLTPRLNSIVLLKWPLSIIESKSPLTETAIPQIEDPDAKSVAPSERKKMYIAGIIRNIHPYNYD